MKRLSFLLVLSVLLAFVGCGGGSHHSTNPEQTVISVAVSPAGTTTMVQSQQKNFSATVTNDSAAQGVTWTVTGTGCPETGCGTLTNKTTTGATYTAPSTGSSNFTATVTATSIADPTKSASATITVVPPPSITTTSLPDGVQNTAYTSTTLAATGGITPYTWTVSAGALPSGMALSSAGVISGTPTAVGTSNFTVQVADSSSPAFTATKALSIVVTPPVLTITTTSLPGGTVQSTYPATNLQATGGVPPITWSVTAGELPAGLTLAAGVISGTPTASGTFDFTVTASDSAPTPQTKTQALRIVVNPALTVTTASLANAAVNTAYTATLAASGGTAPLTWTVTAGQLPAGLTLNSTTGVISGTPTTAGTSNFTVQAKDASTPQQTATADLSIVVTAAPLAITTTSLPNGTIGTAYTATLQASGGTPPISWSVTSGSLPEWASLNSTTGAITGTPSGNPATTNFTVTATDGGSPVQTKTQALSITTIISGANNGELNGHYAFTLQGFDSTGFVTIAGSFVADGAGSVTGVADLNSTTSHLINVAVTGTYSIGEDNRGVMSLNISGPHTFAIAAGGVTSGVATNIRVISTTNLVASGVMKKQDASKFSTASLTGDFTTRLSGAEGPGRFAAAGVITLNGAGSLTVSMDANDAGTINAGSFVGTYAVTDTVNGRGTMTDTTNGSHMAFYIVSDTEAFVINTDTYNASGAPLFTGQALKQSGPFTNASLNGNSIITMQGLSDSTKGYTLVGLITANGAGTFTISMDENDGGTLNSKQMTGTYSVASNGRVTLTVAGQTEMPVLYLVSTGKGFFVGSGNSVDTGSMDRQNGSSFTNATVSGNYVFGTEAPSVASSSVESGVVTGDGAGHITGMGDANQGGTTNSGSITDTYTVSSTGRVVLSNTIMYIISDSKAVMMSADSNTPSIVVVHR